VESSAPEIDSKSRPSVCGGSRPFEHEQGGFADGIVADERRGRSSRYGLGGQRFGGKKTFNFTVNDPLGKRRTISKEAFIEPMVRESGNWSGMPPDRRIYWKVESWDAAGRHSETDVMDFQLTE